MSSRQMTIDDIPCYVSRSGYTGEDGFEIAVPHEKVVKLCQLFLENPNVKLAGLGPRDSLRLEAGLCLYGHDLNEDITPIEAGLTWTIGKSRRELNPSRRFLGDQVILKQLKEGVSKRRVGLVGEKGAPAREHAEIFSDPSTCIGAITSGQPSPSLKKNIAMAYVKEGHHKSGTKVLVNVRNKLQEMTVTKMPFVPARYHRA